MAPESSEVSKPPMPTTQILAAIPPIETLKGSLLARLGLKEDGITEGTIMKQREKIASVMGKDAEEEARLREDVLKREAVAAFIESLEAVLVEKTDDGTRLKKLYDVIKKLESDTGIKFNDIAGTDRDLGAEIKRAYLFSRIELQSTINQSPESGGKYFVDKSKAPVHGHIRQIVDDEWPFGRESGWSPLGAAAMIAEAVEGDSEMADIARTEIPPEQIREILIGAVASELKRFFARRFGPKFNESGGKMGESAVLQLGAQKGVKHFSSKMENESVGGHPQLWGVLRRMQTTIDKFVKVFGIQDVDMWQDVVKGEPSSVFRIELKENAPNFDGKSLGEVPKEITDQIIEMVLSGNGKEAQRLLDQYIAGRPELSSLSINCVPETRGPIDLRSLVRVVE